MGSATAAQNAEVFGKRGSLMVQPQPSLHIEPYTIHLEEAVLSDLRARIRQTRWPDQISGATWEQGTDLAYLREMLG